MTEEEEWVGLIQGSLEEVREKLALLDEAGIPARVIPPGGSGNN